MWRNGIRPGRPWGIRRQIWHRMFVLGKTGGELYAFICNGQSKKGNSWSEVSQLKWDRYVSLHANNFDGRSNKYHMEHSWITTTISLLREWNNEDNNLTEMKVGIATCNGGHAQSTWSLISTRVPFPIRMHTMKQRQTNFLSTGKK